MVAFLKKCENNNYLTLDPLLIPGFFDTRFLRQMLHTVGFYHHAENENRIILSIPEKLAKNPIS